MNSSAETRQAARGLAQQFPGVHAWYGEQTREWWAMVSSKDGPCLLSAPDIRQLREEIISFRGWSWGQR
jgi:hypothetical protein